MVAIPFIYFSCLLLYVLYNKRTFNISAYLISIYLISSFFSILIDINDLREYDTQNYEIGIVPTFVYCALITLVIYPFMKLPLRGKITITVNPKFVKRISIFYIIVFFILLILSLDLMRQILLGDMGALREAIKREGDTTSIYNNINPILQPIARFVSLFANTSMIALLFYFYNICFLNKSKLFNSILFISSMSIVILAILGIDRSKIIYWLISYGFFLILFWQNMTRKQHKNNFIGLLVIFIGLLVYIVTLTVSRFESSEMGVENSIITYAGQSFINFCYFFDNHPYPDYTLQRIFPIFYNLFVDNGINSSVELNRLMTYKTGVFHGVFTTFIGDIVMSANIFTAIIYCTVLSITSHWVLVRNRNRNNIYYFILIFFFCSIPLLGLFTHFYSHVDRVLGFILFVSYSLFKLKNKQFSK